MQITFLADHILSRQLIKEGMKMKKTYNNPEMEIILFEKEDIITTSTDPKMQKSSGQSSDGNTTL